MSLDMDDQTTPQAEGQQVDPVQPDVQPAPTAVPQIVAPEPAPQPSVPAEPGPSVELVNDDNSSKSFSWQASEFIHHQKKTAWYVIFGVVVLALVGVAIVTQQWFSVAVFIAMAAALVVYASKEPRVLQYQLDGTGITIERKHYPFKQFRSYAVFNDVAWHSIDLDPTQRFQPRLTMLFESKDLDTITGLLDLHLAHVDRNPDLVEQITRRLKF
jgi:hypothetical protein